MKLRLFVSTAFDALLKNKMRSALTMLGIVIGIAAIVIIISVGAGAQSLVINQVNSLGTNIIGVLPGSSDEKGPPATAMGVTITSLKYSDAVAIKEHVSGLSYVSGYVKGVDTIAWENRNLEGNYTGVSPDYINVEETKLSRGYFFSDDDNDSLSRVAVLGSQIYDELFNGADPLGATIRIGRQNFRVIGVLQKRGTAAFQSQDDQVFMPVLTAQKIMLGIDHLGFIRAKAAAGQDLSIVAEDVRQLLRERHGIAGKNNDDFSVRDVKQALDVLTSITDVLTYFLAAISALSLLVGGIGIMNIMLVVVLERTREIGLRKAVGARPYHLRTQFLFETMIICLTGGLIGLGLGVLVAFGIASVAQALGYAWDFSISILSIILAFVFPILVGIVFGYYPAQKAANLKPIEALHYE